MDSYILILCPVNAILEDLTKNANNIEILIFLSLLSPGQPPSHHSTPPLPPSHTHIHINPGFGLFVMLSRNPGISISQLSGRAGAHLTTKFPAFENWIDYLHPAEDGEPVTVPTDSLSP